MTDAQHLVVALFTAQPAHPGHVARSRLDAVREKYRGRVETSIVDASTQWRVMQAHGIVDVPTFAVCESGTVKEKLPCGIPDQNALDEAVERHL